ncbi:MAG TPA: rRNA maturation RNase YbeY [Acidimicrobiia bacterium]
MTVNVIDDQDRSFDRESLVSLAEMVLASEGFPSETGVDITAVTDVAIEQLHVTHMGLAGPTDVLSFPLEALTRGEVPEIRAGQAPIHLGDVVLAPDYIARQAERLDVAFADEMALMVVHGILHLMGWDHEDDAEAEQMEARERALLAKVGVDRR